nr:molecular chaperone TorD family protein [Desulfurispira natronophila]
MDSFKNLQKLFAKYSNQELLVDYSALFVGPTELIAAPYGSVYLDGERQLMGDSTMEVIKMYREHGLVIDKDYMNAPDHITAELEFMYYLLHNKVQLLGEGKLEQASLLYQSELKFYGNFLKPWIKPFTENIRKGINNEYYVALAEALQCFVETGVWKDMVPFEELVNPV